MEAAVQVVRDGWFDLLSGDRSSLAQQVPRIPPAWLRESALLSMLVGLVYSATPHRRVKGMRFFVHATRAAASAHKVHSDLDRALILASASVAYRLLGRPRLGVKSAKSALEILHRMTDAERDAVYALPRLYAQLGTTLYYANETAAALSAFEEGLAEIPPDEVQHGYNNLAMLAGIHALQGDIPQAESYLVLARDARWPEGVKSLYPGTFYRIAESVAALERFDLDSARLHLREMVYDRSTIEHWIPIALTEARVGMLELRAGDALAQLDAFAESRQAEGRSGRSRRELARTRALLQLALGSPDAAHVILQRDAEPGALRDIAQARVALALGSHGSALQRLRRVSGARLPPRALAEYASIEAAALLRFSGSSRTEGALQHLAGVLETSHQRLALVLLPQDDYERVVLGLRNLGHGRLVDQLPEVSVIPAPNIDVQLTEAEFRVLQGLLRSPSVATIAGELTVSVNTVKTQLRSIYRKLGVSTRDEAIAAALDRHMLLAPRPDAD